MAGHPQGSNRGFKNYIGIVLHNSTGSTATLGTNSTGLTVDGGLRLNGKTTGQLKANSTAVVVKGPVQVSGKTTGQLSATSTAGVIIPTSLRVGSKTTYFTSNSTGVRLGNKYITGNTTGN